MLAVRNKTPFAPMLIPGLDKEGYNYAVIVVKGCFNIAPQTPTLNIADEQIPPESSDVHYGEPELSSTQYEANTALIKPATDIIVNGHAHAPRGNAVDKMLVSMSVNRSRYTLALFGDRFWERSGLQWRYSPPELFSRMPLFFENAYGGMGSDAMGNAQDFCVYNPVGKGFIPHKNGNPVEGLPLPNIEDPQNLIHLWNDRPYPVGFGFTGKHWQPRVKYAGTYDEQWQQHRMPLLPMDFDNRYFNAALPNFLQHGLLRGGEQIGLINLAESGKINFTLPSCQLLAKIYMKGQKHIAMANMDTVVIEPDQSRVFVSWRITFQCARQFQYIDQIDVEWSEK